MSLGPRRIPLKEFNAVEGATGVRATIRRGQRKRYAAAFDPEKQGKRLSTRQIYGRALTGGGRVGRLPIQPLTGPSLLVMYKDPLVERRVDQSIDETMRKNLNAEINFELSRITT